MVKRTARRRANAGGEFWGCTGYPACRGRVRAGRLERGSSCPGQPRRFAARHRPRDARRGVRRGGRSDSALGACASPLRHWPGWRTMSDESGHWVESFPTPVGRSMLIAVVSLQPRHGGFARDLANQGQPTAEPRYVPHPWPRRAHGRHAPPHPLLGCLTRSAKRCQC